MQSNFKQVVPPADTFTPADSVNDVRRMDHATNDLMGPVLVGGLASSDCFRSVNALQAGTPSVTAYNANGVNDNDEDDRF
jgi:hypothetical protein